MARSVADGFIRRSPVPVLLIRPEAPSGDGSSQQGPLDLQVRPVHFSRILFPVDGSDEAERMLQVAAPLSEKDTGCLLLRVVAPFISGGSPYLPHLVRQIQSQTTVTKAA